MIEIEDSGEYKNLLYDGSIRVSVSEEHNEVLVYEDGVDEPIGRYSLTTGERQDEMSS